MVARIETVAFQGVEARPVDVQVHMAGGIPGFTIVGLADKAVAWPANLSGGPRPRVSLARALISRPRLLVLDAPLGALAALTRIEMQGLLERVWASESCSALLVTHDVAEAVALGDRVIVLEGGRISLDIRIDVPRPRRHGDAELARVEGLILDRLLGR